MTDEYPTGEPYPGNKVRPSSQSQQTTSSDDQIGAFVSKVIPGCFIFFLVAIGLLVFGAVALLKR